MEGKQKIIYIDAANLIISAKDLGLDYNILKLLIYLKDKYKATKCVYFTGKIKSFETEYQELLDQHVEIIFKDIYRENNKTKANCDVEISHRITYDIEHDLVESLVLVTGDGDFSSLLDYAYKTINKVRVFAIDPSRTSKLLTTKNYLKIIYLKQIMSLVQKGKGPAIHEKIEGTLFNEDSIAREKALSIVSFNKKQQAQKILQDNKILEILADFGKVRVGGSYYTNLMSENNDVDITVISEDKRKSSLDFIKFISENRFFQKFEYGDFQKFERQNRPKDFIVVLKIEYENEKWEIEIWFKDSFDENMIELEEKLKNLEEKTRLQILKEKFDRDKNSSKHKLSSYEIYKKYLN